MNAQQTRPVLASLVGFWPTPALTSEETLAWVCELTGPLKITPAEAQHAIRKHAETGAEFRIRPGQIIELVQAIRRMRAVHERPQLTRAPVWEPDEENLAAREACLATWRKAVGRP